MGISSVSQLCNLPSPTQGDFTFYATFDCDSECSYIPPGTPVLISASSYFRAGLRPPRFPSISDLAADSGGFMAARVWGDYRYSLEEYVAWLRSFTPRWAATMDYCCDPGRVQDTRERQDRTTQNAWLAWEHFKQESWVWTPTIQGVLPEDYHRHALELAPLVQAMSRHYHNNPAWRVGIGTLYRRGDVALVQAIVDAVRSALPGVPLHLWGVKLKELRSIDLSQVVSSDSAVWHQGMYGREVIAKNATLADMSMKQYKVVVSLPGYLDKIRQAVAESRRVTESQNDQALLAEARAVLRAWGWTINVRMRRLRRYVYAARRRGKRVEQTFICPVSQLEEWLVRQRTSSRR